jgi:hypothetical protein
MGFRRRNEIDQYQGGDGENKAGFQKFGFAAGKFNSPAGARGRRRPPLRAAPCGGFCASNDGGVSRRK